ncbi:mannose-6-phosphate isomerase, class I [Peribacillus frigoritolerans]|uniref:mannose-6-phosphate isomerase, class I n=1 Tax=Peribacillus frigoritolerans TaxID=450367 RepID=UPI0021A88F88|nr:mannose-6-phosphate isomerase, class I [Peribacillus frigoritolerans]MCT1391444.1 mannose-6-phosphate isomerase, class I [Peribacillus frigoritolerans]
MTILKLKPIFKERIWGGRKLATDFHYQIPDGPIGECWGISAHHHGDSIIEEGELAGKLLSELWRDYRHRLFGDYEMDEFPLLIKILDAKDDLSVQVHPNDQQAVEINDESYGKTECWYVLEAEPNAEITLGHKAKTKEEMERLTFEGKWDELLQKLPVKRGDFILVESGTIHAIGKGIVIYETQQSSDTTYRVYDYDRIDSKGKKRDLHLDKAIQVTTVPNSPAHINAEKETVTSGEKTTFIEVPQFTVIHHKIIGSDYQVELRETFQLLSIIEGSGKVITGTEILEVKKGDHFIITREVKKLVASGEMEWITSYI